ncbi:alginate export protein [Paraburkholderia sp. BL23I1N1]|uniref:alginate export family protein n=1 Tax=Paraburkholderia sp. BL23I1N1 TaxID=1938802 RepID=UPI000E76C3EC|nr:alginate export family protein [Paraburkholderia sp. BL23I1N1]RKE35722.1 alginate export protein [Paraburkholderia sp. BL23I1N1]
MASDARATKPLRSLKSRRRAPRFSALRAARALLISTGLAAALPASAADTALGGADDTAKASTAVASSAGTASCARPAIMFNRWQENWGVLANPCVPKKPLDSLKYIPLFGNPDAYISLGVVLRERLEVNDAPLFGLGSAHDDTYLLQRLDVHADIRLGPHVQIFTQFEDAQPYGKDNVTPVDKNPPDLRQAFVAITEPLGPGTFKFRVGRQEMAFDLQRFVSVRDGPNVRQAFDALWADYETGPWRWIAYATQPVQYRDYSDFDDVSNRDLTFSGLRVERKGVGPGDLSAYYSRYNRSNAHFLDATGDEHRDVFDARYSGNVNHIDWDVEGMIQSGHVGSKTIGAWAVGSLAGYTLTSVPWTPRIGIQVDAASGDNHPGDGRVGTFNPLFPNGYYFALAGYTGYSNLIHVKPSLIVKPNSKLTLLAGVGLQWRETTADAVYQQGSAVVPGTAGHGSPWTGFYTQFRADWAVTANLAAALEAVHFQVGPSLRELGARNADYIGAELKFGW